MVRKLYSKVCNDVNNTSITSNDTYLLCYSKYFSIYPIRLSTYFLSYYNFRNFVLDDKTIDKIRFRKFLQYKQVSLTFNADITFVNSLYENIVVNCIDTMRLSDAYKRLRLKVFSFRSLCARSRIK